MRFSVLTLVAAAVAGFALADCGSSSSNNGNNVDMAGSAGVDMAALYACGDLIDCLNAANGNAQLEAACAKHATRRASTLAGLLLDCITNQCGPDDGGLPASGPCSTDTECLYCVQFGRSPTGKNHGTCTNVDPSTNPNVTITDPKCGQCVDELLACFSDTV